MHKRFASPRSGFTLVELLVVIAIIGVMVGLLLPAVQAAREASRRMSCGNNIRQVALALLNYESAFKKFPLGVNYGNGKAPHTVAYHHTWLTSILPQMEASTIANNVNWNLRAWGQPHVNTQLPNLLCPSDGNSTKIYSAHNLGITCYSGAQGYHWWPDAVFGPWAPWQGFGFREVGDVSGLFAPTRINGMKEITDGTSNVLIIGETDSTNYYGGPWFTTSTGARRRWFQEGVFRSAFVGSPISGWGANEDGQNRALEVDGSGFKRPGQWFRAAPYAYEPTFITAWGINTEWPGASSYHGNAIQAAFADGSVRFTNSNISMRTYVLLNAIADNYVVVDPSQE